MRRLVFRAVLAVLAPALLARPSRAQDSRVRRVGWVAAGPGALPTHVYLDAMREGLRARGWVEGRNLAIDARWGTTANSQVLTAELLGLRPDVIVAPGGMVQGARKATSDVPIVFGFSGDPIEGGLVTSYARPGGNLTGIAVQSLKLVGKRLEFLKQVMPRVSQVAILANPQHPGEQLELKESRAAADRLGIAVQYLRVRSDGDFDDAYAAMRRERPQAIVAFPDALIMSHAATIAAFAREQRIPAVSGWSEFVDAGNFMSYGPNLRDTWRQAAEFVDKLLRGARPGEMPVEQPTSYELVIDARIAKALDLAIPETVRLQAARIVE